jgi:hypothetical protein
MHGPIPASFERLRRLEVLSLEVNSFSGALPPNMCTNMTSLSVSVMCRIAAAYMQSSCS